MGAAFKFRKRKEKLTSSVHFLHKTLNFGHFTLLFCRGRRKNVPLFSDVLDAAVVVVVAEGPCSVALCNNRRTL